MSFINIAKTKSYRSQIALRRTSEFTATQYVHKYKIYKGMR